MVLGKDYKKRSFIELHKMNFNVLFALAANLNFTINFLIDSQITQDFFIFEGEDSSAHLYRENDTIKLYLQYMNKSELYIQEIKDTLEFSWEGYKINGTKMKKIKGDGELNPQFTAFTFSSPILSVEPLNERAVLSLPNSSNINYGYVVGIVLLVAIVFDSKGKVVHMLRQIFQKEDTQHYETMKKIEEMENIDSRV